MKFSRDSAINLKSVGLPEFSRNFLITIDPTVHCGAFIYMALDPLRGAYKL